MVKQFVSTIISQIGYIAVTETWRVIKNRLTKDGTDPAFLNKSKAQLEHDKLELEKQKLECEKALTAHQSALNQSVAMQSIACMYCA